MSFTIDRQLIEVQFVAYVHGEVRMQALRNKQHIPPDAKQVFGAKLWTPWPTDDNTGEYLPEKMKPEEHGVQWAYEEIKRLKPDGLEVLAVLNHSLTKILESQIINQPKEGVATPGTSKLKLSDLREVPPPEKLKK